MTSIAIERLTHETWIMAPSGPARAIDIRFDGSGYGIDLRYGQSDDGYEEYLYVEAGGSVEFAGVGEPKLRALDAVTFEEWQALFEVALAKLDASMAAFAQPVDAPVNLLDAVEAYRASVRESSDQLEAAE